MHYRNRRKLLAWVMVVTLVSFACTTVMGEETQPTKTPRVTQAQDATLTAVFSSDEPEKTAEPAGGEDDSLIPVEEEETLEDAAGGEEQGSEEVEREPLPELVYELPSEPVELTFDLEAESASFLQRPGPSVAAIYQETIPQIDADPGDWAGVWYAANQVVYGPEYYADEVDLSAAFKLGWNEDFLFIAVVVHDSKFVQSSTGSQIWRGDSVELLLDVDVAGDYEDGQLSGDDFQLGFSPGELRLIGKPPEAFIWAPRELSGVLDKVVIAAVLTDDGYLMEVAVPWFVFDLLPAEDMHFGFMLSVSDNDMIGQEVQQSVVSFAPLRSLNDPTTWYDLVLRP